MRLKTKRKQNGAPFRLGAVTLYASSVLLMLTLLFFSAAYAAIPDHIEAAEPADYVSGTVRGIDDSLQEELTANLFGILPSKTVHRSYRTDKRVIPGGDVFGVKFFTKGVIVTGISDVECDDGIMEPAGKAGLKAGDVITSVNGKGVESAADITGTVVRSGGKALLLVFTRDGKEYEASLTPVKAASDGRYKAGMWVRDSTAGIGTITFVDPESLSFAGLGHGIYDVDTGVLLPLMRGAVVEVTLNDIIRGKSGRPGELKGSFGSEKQGSLVGNTPCGVYGALSERPETKREPMLLAGRDELREGEASILSNVDGEGVKEYAIRIVRIYSGQEPSKNFVIEVTDEELLEKTGGIVQGMSGSPILQNGKLVGAVTHVLVNQPTRGYGIFIENMLSEMPGLLS